MVISVCHIEIGIISVHPARIGKLVNPRAIRSYFGDIREIVAESLDDSMIICVDNIHIERSWCGKIRGNMEWACGRAGDIDRSRRMIALEIEVRGRKAGLD